MFNEFLHTIGWKVHSEWDKTEVVTDLLVIGIVVIIGGTIAWLKQLT